MKCLKPKMIVNPVKGEQMAVRCGKCLPCQKFRAGSWTVRLIEQNKSSKGNWFITLTLEDENLTWSFDRPTLSKRDLQLFFKTLRNHNKQMKFKYYAVGEYGENTKRPHYHLLLFDTKEMDSLVMDYMIQDAWKKGFNHVGEVTDNSVRYVAGYLEKDVYGNEPDEEVQRLFSLMSKGIGKDYIEKTGIYHYENQKFEYHVGGGTFVPLPRFYRERIFTPTERNRFAETVKSELQTKKTIKQEDDELTARVNRLKAFKNLKNKRK